MATVGQIDIAMTANAGPLIRQLNAGASAVSSFGASAGQVASLVRGAFAAAMGGSATAGILKLAGAAANAEEAINKIDAVFGKQGKGVAETSKAMADAYGISINAMYDASGKLGSLFQGAGFDPAATAEFSKSMLRLTTDLGRFNSTTGGGFDQAFQKLRSGLAGEAEPLRDYGIFLDEDTVKAKAYSMGLATLGQTLTAGAKIQARANLILEAAGPAIGAAAREADGASAKMEAFWGRVENLQVVFGQSLAPAVGDALGGIGTAIVALGNVWDQSRSPIYEWASAINESSGTAVGSLNVLESTIGSVADAWQVLSNSFTGSQAKLAQFTQSWISGWADIADTVDSAFHALNLGLPFGGMQAAWRDTAKNMQDDIDKLFDDMKAKWDRPLASVVISKEFDAARQKIASMQANLAAQPLRLPGVDFAAAQGKGKGPAHDPFAGAMTLGSKEAASTVLRSRYASRTRNATEDNTKRTAENTKDLAAIGRETIRALGGLAYNVADF